MGEYKITYLPDGKGYTIPSFAYFDSTDEDWNKKKKYLNKEGKSLMSIGSFLIEYKTEKILFDLINIFLFLKEIGMGETY